MHTKMLCLLDETSRHRHGLMADGTPHAIDVPFVAKEIRCFHPFFSKSTRLVIIRIPHKVLCGGLPWLTDAFAFDHFPESHKHDLDVQPERPVVHVPDVIAEFVLPGDGVASVDLRPTRQAGISIVAAHLFGRISFKVFHQQRARTNQAHLTAQDVEEFGQLVQAEGAQETPEAGQTLGVGEQVPGQVGCVCHGPEFIDKKRLSLVSRSLLAKQDGSPKKGAHGDCRQQDERG